MAIDDAESGWSADRPGLINTNDLGVVNLGPHKVHRPQSRTGTRVLRVGGYDSDFTYVDEASGQFVEADRVDTVIVGYKNPHGIDRSDRSGVASDSGFSLRDLC